MAIDKEEQKRRVKNNRLKKLYGITLAEYNIMFDRQGGVCAICGHPPTTIALAVDHDHKWRYLKLNAWAVDGEAKFQWAAAVHLEEKNSNDRYNQPLGFGPNKREAKADLKAMLKRRSVRGLLCFSCNGGLRKYRDSSTYLYAAAKYLEKHRRGE